MANKAEILIVCGHCGNKGNCKVRTEYTREEFDPFEEDETPTTTWYLLECPVCGKIMLLQSYCETPTALPWDSIDKVLYPQPRMQSNKLIPKVIQKEFEATLKVKNISSNACAVLARRTLEAIFAHEKASGRTLMEKVNSLIKSERIPPLLADIAHLGRQIGNLGAHFNESDTTGEDVEIMLDFIETIFEYLYVLPSKVDTVKKRLMTEEIESEDA